MSVTIGSCRNGNWLSDNRIKCSRVETTLFSKVTPVAASIHLICITSGGAGDEGNRLYDSHTPGLLYRAHQSSTGLHRPFQTAFLLHDAMLQMD